MSHDEITEQAARAIHEATNNGADRTEDYAHALADAGLLAQPLPTRKEIATAIHKARDPQYGDFCTPYNAADAVLNLLKGRDQ